MAKRSFMEEEEIQKVEPIPPTPIDPTLIDLQIEESIGRESLMIIDSINRKERNYIFWLIGLLYALFFLIGFFGPIKTLEETSVLTINNGIHQTHTRNVVKRSVRSLVGIQAYFSRYNSTATETKYTDLTFETRIGYSEKTLYFKHHPITFHGTSKLSSPITILPLAPTNGDQINMKTIISDTSNLVAEFVIWLSQNSDYSYFVIVVRILVSAILLFGLIWYAIRMSAVKFYIWHPEQKLTLFLLCIGFIGANPLAVIDLFSNNSFTNSLDAMGDKIIEVFLEFFILIVYNGITYKGRNYGFFLYAFNLIIAIGLAVLKAYYKSIFVDLAFMMILIISVIRAFANTEQSDWPKLFSYNSLVFLSLLFIGLSEIITNCVSNAKNSTLEFFMQIMVSCVIIAFMALFHWPYETGNDISLNDHSDDISPDEFFLNATEEQ